MIIDSEGRYAPIVGAVGSRLVLRFDESAWELRQSDQLLGRIAVGEGKLIGAAGSWTMEKGPRRGPRILFRALPPGGLTAAFYPNRLFRGGIIALSEHHWYRLRTNPLGATSRLVDGRGDELMRLALSAEYRKEKPRPFELALRTTHDPEPAVLLAVLAACYILVVFESYSIGVASAGG